MLFIIFYFAELKEFCCSFETITRSSHAKVFCKKGVLENSVKFTGKHLCQSLFLNKVAGVRPVTLFKKRLWHNFFPVNFAKFSRTPFFLEHLLWMLLKYLPPWYGIQSIKMFLNLLSQHEGIVSNFLLLMII